MIREDTTINKQKKTRKKGGGHYNGGSERTPRGPIPVRNWLTSSHRLPTPRCRPGEQGCTAAPRSQPIRSACAHATCCAAAMYANIRPSTETRRSRAFGSQDANASGHRGLAHPRKEKARPIMEPQSGNARGIQGTRPQSIKEVQDFARKLEREDEITQEFDKQNGHSSGNSNRCKVTAVNQRVKQTEQRDRLNEKTVVTGINKSCYNCGSNDHFVRDCPKPRVKNPNFYAGENLGKPPGHIKYTVSHQSEPNSQPCTLNWENNDTENSPQTPEQR
ncbi:hypothetical protein KM043_016607 [Ampulex compressa]|nr:hypothetical protein KM043_016607 [Ampulex compressa]